uniref:Uncharacterized protein n=1 Tax=Anguilla anguilla TaxID=7936 RepID=A0A0E9SPQ7_ANGAN
MAESAHMCASTTAVVSLPNYVSNVSFSRH